MSHSNLCNLEIEFTVHKIIQNSVQRKVHHNEFMLIGHESIPHIITKLQSALSKTTAEPYSIQYLDDENDLVSIDSEEEYKEFTKLAYQRCSEGKSLKLIVNSRRMPKHFRLAKQPEFKEIAALLNPEPTDDTLEKLTEQCSDYSQWKMDFKSELKQEILQELRDELGATANPNVPKKGSVHFDGFELFDKLNSSNERRKMKIDQRLEKMEMKRKKLFEKLGLRPADRSPMPCILSGIVSKETTSLTKRVAVGKVFTHQWRVINDGTITWKNVYLYHMWSTPELEPNDLLLRCIPLLPGQECLVTAKFRAPKTVGSFTSYWHFVNGSPDRQFGHYVSLSGNTKLPKPSTCPAEEVTKVQDCQKKSKDETKKRTLFNLAVSTEDESVKPIPVETTEEGKAEKSLASAEIAAEMAREAAKALQRRTAVQVEDTADDELSTKIEVICVADSVSDTDDNVDETEELDPGFVIVNYPSTDKTEQKGNNIQVADSSEEEKEINVSDSLKADGNMIPPQIETTENENINTNNKVIEKETVVSKEVMEDSQKASCSQPVKLPEPDTGLQNLPNLPNILNQQLAMPSNSSSKMYSTIGRPLQLALGHNHQPAMSLRNPTSFPVFPPPNSSSNVAVYPPLPMNYFPASNITPSLSYPQIPNYEIPHQSLVFPPPIPSEQSSKPSQDDPNTFTPISFPSFTDIPNIITIPFLSHCEQATQKTTEQTQKSTEGLDVFKNFNLQSATPVASSSGGEQSHNVETTASSSVPQSQATSPNGATVTAPQPTTNGETVTAPNPTSNGATVTAPNPTSNGATVTAPNPTSNGATVTAPNPTTNGATEPIQILPQYLVDGAITVASHAYSTACNALNTFRNKEGEVQVQFSTPGAGGQYFDPVFENNMALMVEMGFRNLERNARLLKRFNNDINQVIGVICTSPGGDNLEID